MNIETGNVHGHIPKRPIPLPKSEPRVITGTMSIDIDEKQFMLMFAAKSFIRRLFIGSFWRAAKFRGATISSIDVVPTGFGKYGYGNRYSLVVRFGINESDRTRFLAETIDSRITVTFDDVVKLIEG